MKDNFVYFPGCLALRKFPGFDYSTRYVLDKLNINYKTSEDFVCCPDPVWIRSLSSKDWKNIGFKNLELAKNLGSTLFTICNGCFETLYTLKKNYINFKSFRVEHLVYTLWKNKKDEIKSKIVFPLNGKKFAIHEGCHFKRPSSLISEEFEELTKVKILKEMVELLGAETAEGKDECCGYPNSLTDKEISYLIAKKRIDNFKEVDGIVVVCPSCFSHFENVLAQEKRELPVYFYFELLAYSLGLDKNKIGFEFHRIKSLTI
ncbi:MAG: heterodisulfide reductase-related iron-sulfur binding cluster [Candidatus Hydrothermales bacterium]